jgi:hypothetical protein
MLRLSSKGSNITNFLKNQSFEAERARLSPPVPFTRLIISRDNFSWNSFFTRFRMVILRPQFILKVLPQKLHLFPDPEFLCFQTFKIQDAINF